MSGRDVAETLGPVGIWTMQQEFQPFGGVRNALAGLERLGYGAFWFIEVNGRESLTQASLLLCASERMQIATGIANIWARDAAAMAAAHRTLSEAYPGRFVLGMGVSHSPLVSARGHDYDQPLTRMREYLKGMDSVELLTPEPEKPQVRVLAALGPKMLELAGERASGALTYLVTPEHTESARKRLGADPVLAVEQGVTLTEDAEEARKVARKHLKVYLGFPNYVQNWRRLGFEDSDFEDGGSDRLVDAMVIWGDEKAVSERVRAHFDAGADHVCLQVLPTETRALPEQEWQRLAEVLL